MINPALAKIVIEVNRNGLSFFPMSQLNAVSIYTTDYYENYDYDIVLPGQRDKLIKILTQLGFKQKTGRVIAHMDERIKFEFPKPNFTLGDDPATKAEKLINKSDSIVLITPTQALLIYLKQFYSQLKLEVDSNHGQQLVDEIKALLYEQPANLDKVREWLGPAGKTDIFILLKQKFRQTQQQGIDDRQQHRFSSQIIDRVTSNQDY